MNSVNSISMVLPAYNEEINIARAVERADAALVATGVDCELIVVNDGSSDRTGEILRELQTKFPRLVVVAYAPNRGYGGALRAGFAAASKEWIFQSDSDNQFDYSDLALLIRASPGHDFVAGFRRPRRDPLLRRLNGWGWNTLVRLLFGYSVRDIDCAFRLFRRTILERVRLTSCGATISTELVVGCKARGFVIAEARVTHLPRQGGRSTGANPRVIVRAFRDLLRFHAALGRQLAAERMASSLSPRTIGRV
jgi:glycosyltransferase involved in cell wall biosynthesis